MAEAEGLPVGLLQYLLLGLIGLTVMAAVKPLGVVLVVAMLVTPAATASMLTHSFTRVVLLGSALSMAASAVGLYISFWWNVASGGAVVLTTTAIFFVVFAAVELGPRLQSRSGLTSD